MADPVFVICYDIARDRTRRRVATVLERRMVRVQDSVFEARMKPVIARQLFAEVAAMGDDDDRFRLYGLNAASAAMSEVHGGAPLPEDADFWLL